MILRTPVGVGAQKWGICQKASIVQIAREGCAIHRIRTGVCPGTRPVFTLVDALVFAPCGRTRAHSRLHLPWCSPGTCPGLALVGALVHHDSPWCTPWGSGPQGPHQGKSWYTRASTRAKPGRLPVVIPVRIVAFPAWLDRNHAQAGVCPGESTDFTLVPALVLTRHSATVTPLRRNSHMDFLVQEMIPKRPQNVSK